MDRELAQALVVHLSELVTDRRRARMEQVLAQRTRRLTVVLEDLYQSHNASAVLRSCECFGVQDVHIVENRNPYHINPDVELGAAQWLTLVRYNGPDQDNTQACLRALRSRGYRLVAATPLDDLRGLDELGMEVPTAVLFGTEKEGLTEVALAEADLCVEIPMYGFTASFNVSVSAALILRDLTCKLRAAGTDWGLSEAEKLGLRLEWLRRTITGSARLEERFLAERGQPAAEGGQCSSP